MSSAVRQGSTGGGAPFQLTVRDLSPDQREVYDAVKAWISDPAGKPILTCGGVAGSGKSTLTGLIGTELAPPIAFCAFTGKAASVLRGKLAHLKPRSTAYNEETAPLHDDDYTSYCGTLHGLLYRPIVVKGTIVGWEKRFELDAPYKLIVTDESSMIPDDLLLDLRSYGIPILAVGDHGQLPPVSGEGFLMQDPDLRLEKIHRQAEGNPIIALSKSIRETGKLDKRLEGEHVRFARLQQLDSLLRQRYANFDGGEKLVTIVYTNRRRVGTNLRTRSILQISGSPKTGEQIVCLKNVRGLPVYNGMRGWIRELNGRETKWPWQLKSKVLFEDNTTFSASMCAQQFNREKTFSSLGDVEAAILETAKKNVRLWGWEDVGHLFDFGYCMTGHRMQGSQCEDVMVVLELPPMLSADDKKRWIYTCISRASERVTLVEA